MHQLKRSDQKIAKILAEINEALKSDKFFAIFNDKRFKIAPMLLVPEDILQQFVGNSETEIRKQFHEFLKQMYEETVNNSNTISTRYEECSIYNDFLESPFRNIAATVSKRKKPGPGSSLTDQPAEKMAKLVIDPNSKDPLV
ncbi:hypothetical protein GPALN_003359 [Globodera pallida]|nr:hypothetical protein GPALN_003359 [Globodera pallida]